MFVLVLMGQRMYKHLATLGVQNREMLGISYLDKRKMYEKTLKKQVFMVGFHDVSDIFLL